VPLFLEDVFQPAFLVNMSHFMDIAHASFRINAGLTLGAEDVHLWRIDLGAIAPEEDQWLEFLSQDERTRAARFHFEVHRQYFTAGRAILRQVLAAYLGADPKELQFSYSEKDKPSLGGAWAKSGLCFNLSHSGEIALVAFTRNRQIGVDVELLRHDFDTAAIAARFFSAIEQEQLAALPSEQRHEAFFLCWTRKESYIKATGEGLSLPLHQFDVSLAPGERNALLATRPNAAESERWSLRDITVKYGYAGALCVSGTGWKLTDWSGSDVSEKDAR
jgi:4'-phosphopantetheinyl transferase